MLARLDRQCQFAVLGPQRLLVAVNRHGRHLCVIGQPNDVLCAPGAAIGKRHVRVIAEELLGALRRVSILSSERARGVKLRVENGMLEVATTNPDIGEAREEIEADYAGDEFAIGFNARSTA